MFRSALLSILAISITAAATADSPDSSGRVRIDQAADIKIESMRLMPPTPAPADSELWLINDSISLYHFSQGHGQPVLFIHGGPGIPPMGPIEALTPLGDKYQFVYYHQRGCGQSQRPIDRFSSSDMSANSRTLVNSLGLDALVSDIEFIRTTLKVDKLLIIGHSFGGFLASMYAAKHPDHVKAMILVAPADVLVMPVEAGGLFGVIKEYLPDSVQSSYLSFLGQYFNFWSIFGKSDLDLAVMNSEFQPFYRMAAQSKGYRVPPDLGPESIGGWCVQGCFMSMGMQYDHRPELKNVTAPVLVIHGGKDLQPESGSAKYVSSLANAKMTVLPESGHFPFLDQPEEFRAVVGEFLDKNQ